MTRRVESSEGEIRGLNLRSGSPPAALSPPYPARASAYPAHTQRLYPAPYTQPMAQCPRVHVVRVSFAAAAARNSAACLPCGGARPVGLILSHSVPTPHPSDTTPIAQYRQTAAHVGAGSGAGRRGPRAESPLRAHCPRREGHPPYTLSPAWEGDLPRPSALTPPGGSCQHHPVTGDDSAAGGGGASDWRTGSRAVLFNPATPPPFTSITRPPPSIY